MMNLLISNHFLYGNTEIKAVGKLASNDIEIQTKREVK